MDIELELKKGLFIPAFFPYLQDYSKRYEVYYGGAGSGKSYFISQKILIKALTRRRKVLIVRKVAATIKDSVFQLIIDLLKKFGLFPYCKVNLTTFTIELPNDSILLFKGLDDPEKIKSIAGLTDIWVEEATELTADDFTQLDLRLRAKADELQLYLSFNPVSKANWCFKRWFSGPENDDTRIMKSTYKDNPFLPPEYVSSLEAMMRTNPTYYRIYALGEFCSLDKLVYNNWTICEMEPPTDSKLIIGLDYGYVNDPSALIVSRVDEANKKLYIVDEWYKGGALNDEIAAVIRSKGLIKEEIIADAAEPKSIEEMKRLGVSRIKPSVKGQGSVMYGIQRLQQYEICVAPKCVNVITELQNYSYKKDKQTNEYINEPVDEFNHALDALRYSIQSIDKPKKIQSISKYGLGL